MSRADIDNMITLGFIAAGFLMIIALMGLSMDFQKRCEAACAPHAAITPIIDFDESCFCDTGSGVWRRANVRE